MKSNNKILYYVLSCIAISAILLYISLNPVGSSPSKGEPLIGGDDTKEEVDIEKVIEEDIKNRELIFEIEALDDSTIVYSTSQSGAYRYGPSIMRHEDGSYDAWFSAPGNNSTQWDWITYRHSDDGVEWSREETILKPTVGSLDKCSVCDPGLIYFNGYYYLAYTSTYDSSRRGYNNQAFVARSTNPNGPFEKWNGESWGGDPQPIISYDGDPNGWGVGEVSFVILNEDLFIYYTYYDLTGGYVRLAKADLVDDWPATMRDKGTVCPRINQDSFDVVYIEDLDCFLAFTIDCRMSSSSRIAIYYSKDGKSFEEMDKRKTHVEEYAHNIGISKDEQGHIRSDDDLFVGYAFGASWGRWSAKFQKINLTYYYR